MYIRRMVVENTEVSPGSDSQIEVALPTDEEIVDAIRAMNGRSRSTVILQGEDPDLGFMGLGGGAEGGVFCFVVDQQGDEFALYDPGGPTDSVRIFAGEVCQRARREVFDREVVIPVALFFSKTGRLDPSTNWREL